MLLRKLRSGMSALLLTVSLLMTASCASNGSLFGNNPTSLTNQEVAEVDQAIVDAYPRFPYPTLEALTALRNLNDPAVNQWVQDLAILCRQLEEECRDD